MKTSTNMRIERLRANMAAESIDALVIRDARDLRWATGFARVFDSEEAHTALVTQDGLVIHTDSRYAAAMRAAAANSEWVVDDAVEKASAFARRTLAEQGLCGACIGIDTAMSLALFRSFEAELPEALFKETESLPLSLRARKDAAEIDTLKRAQHAAEQAFYDTIETMHAGMSEREVALNLEYAMRAHGADGTSFSTIVASGPNGANPHAIPSDRRLEQGDLVVIDFGAELDGYCSDTTRVVSVGKPSAEQQRAYDAVRCANETVEARLAPGVTGKEMHELALRILEEHGFGGLMGHGLGHGVGLAIHELPNLNARNGKPLEAGNVVTVEPGVYVEGRFGIRLEDCGAITQNGFESFCTLPHDITVV